MGNILSRTENAVKNNKPKKLKNWILISIGIVVIIAVLFYSHFNTIKSYEKQYILKAQELCSEYNLSDANINFEFIRTDKSYSTKYRLYDLTMESSEFEKFDNSRKLKFTKSLDGISVDNAIFIVFTNIISNGNEYRMDIDNGLEMLYRNGIEIHVEGTENNSVGSISGFSREPSDDDKAYAWTAAIREVKERLKAPSTAKFPSNYNEQDIKEVELNTFVVKSYVDAENSFGAKLRSNFMVKIKRTGENTYKVLDVQIYE